MTAPTVPALPAVPPRPATHALSARALLAWLAAVVVLLTTVLVAAPTASVAGPAAPSTAGNLSGGTAPAAFQEVTGVSPDGRIRLTTRVTPTTLPPGGQQVTVTYTVTNTSDARAYYVGLTDDRCPTPRHVAGMLTDSVRWYLEPGATATFTCDFFASVTQTATAAATFTTSDGAGAWTDSTATTSVQLSATAGECDAIWYSSLLQGTETGRIGTVSLTEAAGSTTAAMSPRWSVAQLTGGQYDSAAAFAVDPVDPTIAYFVPTRAGSSYGGLWRLDTTTGTATRVLANSAATTTVRLAMDAHGTLWSWNTSGVLYSLDRGATTWVAHTLAGARSADGRITLSSADIRTLGSGDLVVGGAGNIYLLAANTGTNTTYLLALSDEQARTTNPQALVVGLMNRPLYGGYYNGLAFAPDGRLIASAGSASSTTATNTLYSVDMTTGRSTPLASAPNAGNGSLGDLGSCSMPRSRIQVLKRAITDQPAVRAGDLVTYQVEIANLGSLAAVDVVLRDAIPANTTYVAGSTTLNGAPVADVAGAMPYSTPREVHGPGTPRAGIVPAGETAVVRFSVRVDDPLAADVTDIRNQATVTDINNPGGVPSDDPGVPGASDPTITPIARPRIGLTKTASTPTVDGSGEVTFTYSLSNLGAEPLAGVRLADTATLGGAEVAPYACADPTYVRGDDDRDLVLDRYETWIHTCTETLGWDPARDPDAGTSLTNTATATALGTVSGLPTTASASATTSLLPLPAALTMSKTPGTAVGPDSETGEIVASYSVVVTNEGQLDGAYGPVTDTPRPPAGMRVVRAEYVPVLDGVVGDAVPVATDPVTGAFTIDATPDGDTPIAAGDTHRYRLRVWLVWTSADAPELRCEAGGGVANTVALPDGQEVGGTGTDNAACVDAPHPPRPALTLVKTGTAPAPVDGTNRVGDEIAYAFTVTNTSPDITLQDVAIEDPLATSVTCPPGPLAPGEVITCTGTHLVTEAELADQQVTNTATATALPAGFTARIASDPATVTVPLNTTAAISLTKTADTSGLAGKAAGDPVRYTFTVTNTGTKPVTAPTVDDPVLGLTALPCGTGPLAVGGVATCSAEYVLTDPDIERGRFVNVATAHATGIDVGGSTDAAPVTAVATETIAGMAGRAGLWLEKQQPGGVVDTDGSGDHSAGDTLWYTFRVRNLSDETVTGIDVVDDKAGAVVYCDATALDPWESTACRLSVPYAMTDGDLVAGAVVNTAIATGTGVVSGPVTSNEAAVTTPLVYTPALGMTKTAGALVEAPVTEDSPVGPSQGDTIDYAITVTNPTALAVTGLTVTDPLVAPATFTCVDADGAATTTIPARGTVTCTASAPYTVTRADIDARGVTNTATASAEAATGDPVTAEASAAAELIPLPRLTMTKSHAGPAAGTAVAGDVLTYTFTLTNAGAGTLHDLRVVDPMLGVDDWCTTPDATLAPGETVVCTPRPYTLTQHDQDLTTVENLATGRATSGYTDAPVLLEAHARDIATTAVPAASLSVDKHFDQLEDVDRSGGPTAGDLLHYRFTLTNTGAATLRFATVDDPRIGLEAYACGPGDLAPGATVTCLAPVHELTAEDLAAGPVFVNTVEASASTHLGEVVRGTDTEVTDLGTAPRAGIAHSATGSIVADANGDGLAQLGDQVSYTFTVTNTGTVTLDEVGIASPLLADAGARVTCLTTTLPPGASTTCTSSPVTVTEGLVTVYGVLDPAQAPMLLESSSAAGTVSGAALGAGEEPPRVVSEVATVLLPLGGEAAEVPVTPLPEPPGPVDPAGPTADPTDPGAEPTGDPTDGPVGGDVGTGGGAPPGTDVPGPDGHGTAWTPGTRRLAATGAEVTGLLVAAFVLVVTGGALRARARDRT